MVAETKSFLKLELRFVAQILSSSQLNISTELEVFKAAHDWLRCSIVERSKFAKELLFKVRLPLLSNHALDSVLSKDSSFRNSEESLVLVNDILKDKATCRNSMKFSCTTRYCNQNMFNLTTFNDDPALPSLTLIRYDSNENKLTSVQDFPQLSQVGKYLRAVFINGDFYVFFCIKNLEGGVVVVQKYLSKTNSWDYNAVASFNIPMESFGVCVFMRKVYLIGGLVPYGGMLSCTKVLDSCLEFNSVNYKIQNIKPMNECRYAAACTVFKGRVVVSGGEGIDDTTNAVEFYDHVADKWSYMPNMVKRRAYHGLVAVKNKLFAIGGRENTCEVYDSCSKRFSLLNLPKKNFKFNFENTDGAISMGNKIVVFNRATTPVALYDLNKEQWSEESIEMEDAYDLYGCFKLPQF